MPKPDSYLLRFAWLLACFAGLSSASAAPVSFTREIAPILAAKCLGCHDSTKAKGKYQLQNFDLLMKPGGSGKAPVLGGKPADSHLLELLLASDPDDRMPQKDDALPAIQIQLVKQWIVEGAAFDGPATSMTLGVLLEESQPAAPELYPARMPVTALALMPGAQKVWTSGLREILDFNAAKGELTRRLGHQPKRIQALDLSPDGKWLASAGGSSGKSGQVRVLELGSTNQSRLVASYPDLAFCVRFAPATNRFAASAADNTIRIFSLPEGRELLKIEQHADWVLDLNWSADGKRLISASRDRSARVYNTTNGELETSFIGHEMPVNSACFLPDGKTAVSCGRDRKIHFWTIAEGNKTATLDGFEAEPLRVISIKDKVFVLFSDGMLRAYSTADRKEVGSVKAALDWPSAISIDAKAETAAVGAMNGDVTILSLKDFTIIRRFSALPGFTSASN